METIEPIHFEIEGRGLDIDNEFPRSREWNQTKLHLLDTAVSDFCDPINDNKLRKKYMKVFESELEQVTEILPNFGQTTPPGLEVPSIPGTVYLHDNSFIVPNMNEDGIMYIISNNKNKARTLRDDVIRELKEKQKWSKVLELIAMGYILAMSSLNTNLSQLRVFRVLISVNRTISSQKYMMLFPPSLKHLFIMSP